MSKDYMTDAVKFLVEDDDVGESIDDNGQHTTECTHYWKIDPPHGATSIGICKFCDEKREFTNSFNNHMFEKANDKRRAEQILRVKSENRRNNSNSKKYQGDR